MCRRGSSPGYLRGQKKNDHPQSSIGRLFFPIAVPLNAYFGHRGLCHAFIVWTVPMMIALFTGQELATWFFIGALSHCFIDCYNVSGVKAFLPFTEQSIVLFKRSWRVTTGSLKEIWVFLVIFGIICSLGYAHTLGGPRRLLNMAVRSHKITVEDYQRAGLARCDIEGTFRWADGTKEDLELLVVGLERKHLVAWNGSRLIRNPKHGKWLRSTLRQSKEEWELVTVTGFVTCREPVFWFSGEKWRHADPGQIVFGKIKTASGAGLPTIITEGNKK